MYMDYIDNVSVTVVSAFYITSHMQMRKHILHYLVIVSYENTMNPYSSSFLWMMDG